MDRKPNSENEPVPGIKDLARVPDPPWDARQKLLAELRRRGQIRTVRTPFYRHFLPTWQAALLSLLALGLGFALRPWIEDFATPPPDDLSYLLLLKTGEAADLSPRETERRVGEYASWARDMARRNQLLSGEKLEESGFELTASRQLPLPAPSSAQVEGFFLIRASDLGSAVRIAQSCPHLRYGGTIEVRPIDQSGGE